LVIKVGLIGCGGIAPVHLRAYKKLRPKVDVVALCDINREKAESFARKFKVEKIFESYFDMFDKCDLDLVDICTPISTHAKIVCDSAKEVQAILVEKPMALNVTQCDEMIAQVEKHKTKLCVGHNQIFSPHIQKIRKMIDDSGFILLSLRTHLAANFDVLIANKLVSPLNILPQEKGVLWEVCCHHAYLQQYFLPSIQEVYAIGNNVKYPVYDDFIVLLRTKGEQFGLIDISWVSNEMDVVYDFRGRNGKRIEILWEFNYMLERSANPPFTIRLAIKNILTDEKRLLKKWFRLGLSHIRKRKTLPTFNLIRNFIESIEMDLPPPVTPEDGKKTVKLLECIEESIRKSELIRVNY
jgi:predicted dehydrogenase